MPATSGSQLTIEKTPSYFVTNRAAERLRQMSPDVRLLVVLRDPVARALSDYAQASAKRPGLPPFEHLAFRPAVSSHSADDVNTTAPRRLGVNNASRPSSYGSVNATWRALQIGLYDVHLRRWTEHFRRDRMHFVSGERLVADPASTLADVQRFLGLRPAIGPDDFRSSPVKPGFPCVVRRGGGAETESVHCLGENKGRRHPTVDGEALRRLRDFFRPHNERLYRMTGIDFGWQ